MAERSLAADRWVHGTLYVSICAALMLIHVVPLSIGPGRFPGPDLIVCITYAWLLRRPHLMPTPIIALVFLIADVVFMRPLGLYAALTILAVEFLRARDAATREQTFPAEWLMITMVILITTLANRAILAIFFVEQVAYGLILFQAFATIVTYPLIVFASRVLFGIGKLSASEAEAQGRT